MDNFKKTAILSDVKGFLSTIKWLFFYSNLLVVTIKLYGAVLDETGEYAIIY